MVHLSLRIKRQHSVWQKKGLDFGDLQSFSLNPGFAIYYRLMLVSNLTFLGLSL